MQSDKAPAPGQQGGLVLRELWWEQRVLLAAGPAPPWALARGRLGGTGVKWGLPSPSP